MIYDCFIFYNELDLLEIRLYELYPVVDKFVIVEATRTHQNDIKPLYFEQNMSKFKHYADKLIYVVVNNMPTSGDSWVREKYQRAYILSGLQNCTEEDIILISDIDEIPSRESIPLLVEKLNEGKEMVQIEQDFCYYFMNGHVGKWNGTKGVHYSKNLVPEKIRYPDKDVYTIPNGGWHYSYLGGVNRIISKLSSFAHREFNTPFYKDKERLKSVLSSGNDLFNRDGVKINYTINCNYPKLVSENLEKYKEYIYAV